MPAKAGLPSTEAWLRGPFVRNQNRDYQMSKKTTKTKYRWWFKTIGVNKTRSCACKLKYLLLYKWFWIFFLTFPKQWVGRAMGNETFYGDGLTARTVSCWKLESQTVNVTARTRARDFYEVRGSRYSPKKSLLKVSKKAKRLCETDIKKKKIRLKPVQVFSWSIYR